MTEVLVVIVWGTIAGLDLVTGPQVMLARPLVAGSVAGALAGDVMAGLTVGAVLELFALEVLPIGGGRYADYGPAAVAGAWSAAQAPLNVALGPSVLLGLVVAWVGEESMQFVRRRNDARVQANRAALDAGDERALVRVQLLGIGTDTVRAATLTMFGLGLAVLVRDVLPWSSRMAVLLGLVLTAMGAGTAAAAALRIAGRGAAARWLMLGITIGAVTVALT